MSDFYPLAKGHMHEVWATGECPICGDDMGHVDDDILLDDNEQPVLVDTYGCDYCHLLVMYVSPADGTDYHETADSDKRYCIERMI